MTKLQERLRISDERLVDWNDALERRSHFGPHACITVWCYELQELLDNRKALDAAEARISALSTERDGALGESLKMLPPRPWSVTGLDAHRTEFATDANGKNFLSSEGNFYGRMSDLVELINSLESSPPVAEDVVKLAGIMIADEIAVSEAAGRAAAERIAPLLRTDKEPV